MNPLQYAVYKGTGGQYGAVQFNFQRSHFYNGKQKDFTGDRALAVDEDGRQKLRDGWKAREGCIFMEITSTKDKNVYDWDNKIIMAMSISDMGKLLLGLNNLGETKLMHDPGAKTDQQGLVKKLLKVTLSGQGAMFLCSQSSNGENKSHSVPLSPDEVVVLRILLQQAISQALNW
jgi:hypothetical protein